MVVKFLFITFVVNKLTMETITIKISDIKNTPNNMELGEKVRENYYKTLEESNGKEDNTK